MGIDLKLEILNIPFCSIQALPDLYVDLHTWPDAEPNSAGFAAAAAWASWRFACRNGVLLRRDAIMGIAILSTH